MKPWTDPDPQPGDCEVDLAAIHLRYVEVIPANPDERVAIVVGIEGPDAERLQRLATARRQRPGEVIGSVLRSA